MGSWLNGWLWTCPPSQEADWSASSNVAATSSLAVIDHTFARPLRTNTTSIPDRCTILHWRWLGTDIVVYLFVLRPAPSLVFVDIAPRRFECSASCMFASRS